MNSLLNSASQKIYFSASCSTRLPLFPVTSPNDPLVGLDVAPPQFGWLNTLYISNRNCSNCRSQVAKFLRTAPSTFQKPGLRNVFRGCTPNVPASGAANTALLNHTAE